MTQTTYTPTLIEKLLGRNYKWWYYLIYRIKQRTTYQINNSLFALGQILILIGTIITWLLASNSELKDPEFQLRLTYFIVGTFFINFIASWPSFFGYEIKNGHHVKYLLYPQSTIKSIWASYFGVALFQNFIVCLILLASFPIWRNFTYFSLSLESLVFLFLILPFSHLILFFLEFLVGLTAFWTTEIDGLVLNFGFLSKLLAGQLFPLNLLISNIFLNLINPFAYLFFHPMQIYLGNYNLNQILLVFAGGIAWCIVLYFLAKLVFKMGLKRNESVGL